VDPEQKKQSLKLAYARYRVKHKEKIKISLAAYRAKNRELIRVKRAVYRKNNKEKCEKAKRLSYAKNPIALIIMCARRSAKARGLICQITRADLLPLPVECPVLGIRLDYAYGTKNRKALPNSPSVDRIDNTKGYIPGNVQIISWKANRLKSNGTPDELMRVARYAAQVSPKRSNGSHTLSKQEALFTLEGV
jgi:hypothetical protein